MRFRTAFASALLILAPAATAQERRPMPNLPAPAVSQAMSDAEIAAGMDAWLTQLNADGAARDGREVYSAARGVTALEGGVALNAETRFPIASIGKVFTHTAIAQLIEAGRLTLETTVGEIIPDYPQAATRGATIAQLLNHRGGVADIFGPHFRDAPKEQLASNADYYRLVSTQPPMFAPGEREEYCNGCYVVLGEIIARVSGQTYEAYVAEHLFARVGMSNTAFLRRDALPANTASFIGRPQGPQGPLMDVSQFHGYGGSAAGNVYSTLGDLLSFDNALRDGRLVNAEHVAQILRGQPQTGRSTARAGFAGGGPGVNTTVFGNGAWTWVVLTNREPPTAEAMTQTVFPLLAGPRPQ
jgi:CubicO group peptidase (beta-lactamase class C family)